MARFAQLKLELQLESMLAAQPLQVYTLQVTSYTLRVTSYKLQELKSMITAQPLTYFKLMRRPKEARRCAVNSP